MGLNPGCTLESSGELLEKKNKQKTNSACAPPYPINSASLGTRPGQGFFLKLPRWFQLCSQGWEPQFKIKQHIRSHMLFKQCICCLKLNNVYIISNWTTTATQDHPHLHRNPLSASTTLVRNGYFLNKWKFIIYMEGKRILFVTYLHRE